MGPTRIERVKDLGVVEITETPMLTKLIVNLNFAHEQLALFVLARR
jgi:hypothetical protein